MLYRFAPNATSATWDHGGFVQLDWSPPVVFGAWGSTADGSARGGVNYLEVQPPAYQTSIFIGPTIPRLRSTPIDDGQISGTFFVGILPSDPRFEARVASVGAGDIWGTRFTVRVAPSDGSSPATDVGWVDVQAAHEAELVVDLSGYAGVSVVVSLITSSHPRRSIIKTHPPKFRSPTPHQAHVGMWYSPRLGSLADLTTTTASLSLGPLTVDATANNGYDQPLVAAFAYVIDGTGVSDRALATPPDAPVVRTFLPTHPSATPGTVRNLIPFIHEQYSLYGLTVPSITSKRMAGSGDPKASFLGVVVLCLELDQSTQAQRDQAVADLHTGFVTQAEAALQALVPGSGAKTGLSLSDSSALRAKLDAIVVALRTTIAADLAPSSDPDDVMGIQHVVWTQTNLEYGPPGLMAWTTFDAPTEGATHSKYEVVVTLSTI